MPTKISNFNFIKKSLPHNLKLIDNYLNSIRNDGRQVFIENPSNNFSRILHDYSADRKGFIIWKDLIEERLT